MRRILEAEGYRVLETTNPEHALRLFAAHAGSIDLIVSDVRMPKLDGHELVRRCRTLSANVKALFVTGDSGRDGTSPPLSSDPLMPKPFTPTKLVTAVRQAWAWARARAVL